MSLGRYALGLLLAVVALAPTIRAARLLCRRFCPELRGAPAVLAETILVLATVVVVGELLGTVGLFRVAPFVAAMALVGLGIGAAVQRGDAPSSSDAGAEVADGIEPPSDSPAPSSWTVYAAVIAVAALAGTWFTRVFDSLHHGMLTADTLWYHMPVALRFVQTGWTSHLHFVDGTSLTAFFPATSELLHATGVMLFGTDWLSPFLNVGWMALALLAAWCIGAPAGVAPATLVGAAIVLATPEIVLDDAGSALTDVVSLALLLATVALLVHVRASRPSGRDGTLAIAALAAGLAVGTKFTMLAPVAALTIYVVFGIGGALRRRLAWWFGPLFLAGGYFYVRNLVRTGSPLPNLKLGLGPIHLPSAPTTGQDALVKYIADSDAWRNYFLPGLRIALGPLWWLMFAFMFAGLVGVIVVRTVRRRYWWIGFVGLVTFVAFVVSPQILTLLGRPFWFVVNVRYAAPALALGLLCLPVAVGRRTKYSQYLFAAYLVTFVVTLLARAVWVESARTRMALPTHGLTPKILGIAVGVGCGAIGIVVVLARRGTVRVPIRAWLAASVALVVIVGFGAGNYYVRHRYIQLRGFEWARHVHDSRVAVLNLILQYQLYGGDLSNHVQYIAHRDAHGRSRPIATCEEWRAALRDGGYTHVVIFSLFAFPNAPTPPAVRWTRSVPGTRLLASARLDTQREWAFELGGPPDPATCPSAKG